jgi:DNA polymerase-4
MDCFFVNVERLLNPKYIGKPIIVCGGLSHRSVVSCASYEARKYGVTAAMPVPKAKQLCPHAIFIKGNWKTYSFYSNQLMQCLYKFTPDVEQVSIDEAYLNLAGTERLWGHPYAAASLIQKQIKKDIGLDATIGIASNKLVAKIASTLAKPKGILCILPGYEANFLGYLPIEKIPGIGPKTTQLFNELNIKTVQQFLSIPSYLIKNVFGNNALSLYFKAKGIDHSKVSSKEELPKSISKEITFDNDTEDISFMLAILHHLTEELCRELRTKQLMCKTITLKLRYCDFTTVSKSHQLTQPTQVSQALFPHIKNLLYNTFKRRVRIRLLGISLSQLTPQFMQPYLFSNQNLLKLTRLSSHIDKIKNKYGSSAITNADILPFFPLINNI